MKNDIIALANFIDLYNTMIKIAFIRKLPNGKYRVLSEKGKNLGTYNTKEEAKNRLRQVEFFKHKKASADLSHLKNFTYSSVVRELNKINDKDMLNNFIQSYKNCFDKLVGANSLNPEDQALPEALLQLKKNYNVKLDKK